ncbi:uncharacterized protein LOC108737162 [Agrilus planipennis]|uniref:Uncharacterized protein LOC108737162 n=1 Tax=Agrilus planipennis TaxID=224129 RepID=A0A1W4WZ73_AGRPL|nr:uncharacterized protein LOC108737162 [Agrilus planipennis]
MDRQNKWLPAKDVPFWGAVEWNRLPFSERRIYYKMARCASKSTLEKYPDTRRHNKKIKKKKTRKKTRRRKRRRDECNSDDSLTISVSSSENDSSRSARIFDSVETVPIYDL